MREWKKRRWGEGGGGEGGQGREVGGEITQRELVEMREEEGGREGEIR